MRVLLGMGLAGGKKKPRHAIAEKTGLIHDLGVKTSSSELREEAYHVRDPGEKGGFSVGFLSGEERIEYAGDAHSQSISRL